MKKIAVILLTTLCSFRAAAQQEELQQLALNIEKLVQFKKILSNLQKAYRVLHGGYTNIKNIAEGNFKLHEIFLDGLLEASPAVKKYKKITAIVALQLSLVKEYKGAFTRFQHSGHFTSAELSYMGKVYGRLFEGSLQHLDELSKVLLSKTYRMSDAERLQTIDAIYSAMREKMNFLRRFNTSTTLLGVQRAHELQDVNVLRKLHAIK